MRSDLLPAIEFVEERTTIPADLTPQTMVAVARVVSALRELADRGESVEHRRQVTTAYNDARKLVPPAHLDDGPSIDWCAAAMRLADQYLKGKVVAALPVSRSSSGARNAWNDILCAVGESAILTCDTGDFPAYAAALAPLGLERLISMPVAQAFVKEVVPASEDDRARLADAAAAIERYGAVVVAGPHPAFALVAALGERRNLPPVWAIGSATAAALAGTGIIARTPEGADPAGRAAAVLASGGAGMRILMPKAEGSGVFHDGSPDTSVEDEVIDALVAAGATVDAVSACRLRGPAAHTHDEVSHGLTTIDRHGLELIGLFSPVEVVAFERIITTRGGLALRTMPALIAIDASTAAAIVAAGGSVAAVAAAPTTQGFADAARLEVVRLRAIRGPLAGTHRSLPVVESQPTARRPAASDPEGVIERARASLRVFLREGRRRGDLHAAIRIWKGLAPLMPGSVEPDAALGDLYCELRLFPEAKANLIIVAEKCQADRNLHGAEMALLRILGFDPVDLKTRSKLADLYALQGRRDCVVAQHLAIAHCLAAMGHGREAIQVLERGLRRAGEHPELRRQLDALAHGGPASPRGDESLALPFFQLREIFDEVELTSVLDRPAWTAGNPGFAAEWASRDALVRSRVVVPAEIVRTVARECPCKLVLYAGPDGVTLHRAGLEHKPQWSFHDSTGQRLSGDIPDAVLLTTERAFEEYGAHAVWLALERGSSYKGERYTILHDPSRERTGGPHRSEATGRESDPSPRFLSTLWDSECGRNIPDLDRLLAAGRAARVEVLRGVEEHLAEWVGRHFTPGGVDTASCFLTGYWPGQQHFNLGLVDRLTEALERPDFPPGVWASTVVALCCSFAALDAPRQARIRRRCAAVGPRIRDGWGSAVTAALDTIAR